MAFSEVTTTINAPPDVVFETVSSIENFSKAVPHITEIEFLTENKTGLGARFREKRAVRGREHSQVLEVMEYEPGRLVRMVSKAGGSVWDTLFTVTAEGDGTRLDTVMDARPKTFLARITLPLIRGAVSKAIEADIDAIKTYCESL